MTITASNVHTLSYSDLCSVIAGFEGRSQAEIMVCSDALETRPTRTSGDMAALIRAMFATAPRTASL